MPLPRLPAVGAGLCLAALALANGAAPSGHVSATRPVIVAGGAAAATATAPDGSWRLELPWLLPGDTDPAVSPDGRRIAFSSARTGHSEIYLADAATGTVTRLTASPSLDDRSPAWSPDGRRIAWTVGPPGRGDVFAMRADGTRKQRLAGAPSDDSDPAWSPDGTRVAFATDRNGALELWSVSSAGGEPEPLLGWIGAAREPDWSPDGKRIAFSGTVNGATSVWVLDPAGEPRRVTRSTGVDLLPDWSPDGRQIAFTRVGGGATRTWVVDARSGPGRPLSGTDGDVGPEWATVTESLAPGPDQLLPDLDQQAPADLVVRAQDGGFHLGFASAVDSVGRGPLRIRGWRPAERTTMRADQVIELRAGGTGVVRGVGALHYQAHPPHRHWHLRAFERYELRRASDHVLVARDRKSGFCLLDRYGRASARVPHVAPPRFVSDCGAGQRDLRRVEEGSSPGYVDRYPAFFHGQDLDVTIVPAGIYVLVHRANPDRGLREARYSNNAASVRLSLTWPGGRAAPPRVVVLRRCADTERCPPP